MSDTPQANSQPNSQPSMKTDGIQMGFWDHIEELRVRLMRILYAFLGGFALAYYYLAEPVMEFLRRPLFKAMPPEQQKLYFTSLFENFMTHLKVSGYATLAILSPYIFYEVWAFVAPGLKPSEKKLAFPFIFFATVFFVAGMAFAYFVLFPKAFSFFVTYGGPTDVPMLTIDAFYGTALKLLFLFGAAFEFPVLILLLGFLGVFDAKTLRSQRKTAFLVITVCSAFIAPPDAISMLLLMAPLVLMYELSIFGVAWIQKRKAGKEVAVQDSEPPNPLEGKSR